MDRLPPTSPPLGIEHTTRACALGPESNLGPPSSQGNTLSAEPHQPGLRAALSSSGITEPLENFSFGFALQGACWTPGFGDEAPLPPAVEAASTDPEVGVRYIAMRSCDSDDTMRYHVRFP
uniref:Uncharacterized protein n=1 Tax=Myotis myotis TaxID=51298 RepID=A0A7J7SBU9_MYOMY|nr:hypothetical protein mMyoMyo1_009513 [Myotis myotis]